MVYVFPTRLRTIFIAVAIAVMAACTGSTPIAPDEKKTNHSAVYFGLQWPIVNEKNDLTTKRSAIDSDACIAYEIGTINVTIRDEAETTLATAQFSCSAHRGTIADVPIGNNYRLSIAADGYNGIEWIGETSISILDNTVVDAGLIPMTPLNDEAPPEIIETTPADKSYDVPMDSILSVTFSEKIVVGSISEENVIISMVSGEEILRTDPPQVTYDPANFKASITPSGGLLQNTSYRVTITPVDDVAIQDMAGNRLEPSMWTFSTSASIDTIGPQAISSSPEDNEMGVALNTSIAIRFDEPLDSSSVVPENVQLLLVDQVTAGDLSYDSNDNSVTFRPTTNLTPGAVYSITISSGITDLLGNPMPSPDTISFVTVPGAPDLISPANDSVIPSTGISFQWAAPSGNIKNYQLQLSDSDQLDEPTSFFVDTTQVDIPDTPLGLQYWRVRAIDEHEKSGAWSTVRHFDGDRTIWLQQRGNEMVTGSSVITLQDGNIVVGGSMIGEMDGYTVENYNDIFLLHFDRDGGYIRTRVVSAPEDQFVSTIAANASESIYITGYTYLPIGGSSFWGLTSAFLVKYRFDGELAFKNAYGADGGYTKGSDLIIDGNGDVILSGFTQGDLETHLDNDTPALFVAKTQGGLSQLAPPVLYQKIVGDASSYTTMDSQGNIYAATSTAGDLGEYTNEGASDICLVSWNPQNGKRWARLYGGSGEDRLNSIAIDQADNIYICGTSASNWDQHTPGSLNSGGNDILVAKFNTDGDVVWVKLIGSPGDEDANEITFDSVGNVFITGYTNGDLNGYINKGQADIIVAKLSPDNGVVLWLEGLGTAEFDSGNAICTDNRDDIIVTGRARGRLNNLPPTGGVFVWKLTGRDE